jgi:hypothetical protein
MFLLSLLRHIYKSASFGLRNIKREGKNGTRLVLRLTFALKIEHSSENPGCFCFIIISAVFMF